MIIKTAIVKMQNTPIKVFSTANQFAIVITSDDIYTLAQTILYSSSKKLALLYLRVSLIKFVLISNTYFSSCIRRISWCANSKSIACVESLTLQDSSYGFRTLK